MKLWMVGFLLVIILALPPVANLLESIMIVHMHMQMPLLVIAGFFTAPFFQKRFPNLFAKWNSNGVPGILLFIIVNLYWMTPRAMDEALTMTSVEIFKFISLPFLAGVPLRDSWQKLSQLGKNIVLYGFTFLFFGMGWLYIYYPDQICNNYLKVEQITLGWGFWTLAICIIVYLIYAAVVDPSEYE